MVEGFILFLTVVLWVALAVLVLGSLYWSIKHKQWFYTAYIILAEALILGWQPNDWRLRLCQVLMILGLWLICDNGQKRSNLKSEMRETQRELDELNEEPV